MKPFRVFTALSVLRDLWCRRYVSLRNERRAMNRPGNQTAYAKEIQIASHPDGINLTCTISAAAESECQNSRGNKSGCCAWVPGCVRP
jgi:hypothetical protein